MAERNRRFPKRPALFWSVFAAVAVTSIGATSLVALKASTATALQPNGPKAPVITHGSKP